MQPGLVEQVAQGLADLNVRQRILPPVPYANNVRPAPGLLHFRFAICSPALNAQSTLPLLLRRPSIRLQDLVDDRDELIELRLGRRLRALIARRRRVGAHLVNRRPADPENPGSFTLTVTLDYYKTPNCRVRLHGIHPLAARSRFGKAQSLSSG
jgi:hypothetical protein